jgi:hypothetical protein
MEQVLRQVLQIGRTDSFLTLHNRPCVPLVTGMEKLKIVFLQATSRLKDLIVNLVTNQHLRITPAGPEEFLITLLLLQHVPLAMLTVPLRIAFLQTTFQPMGQTVNPVIPPLSQVDLKIGKMVASCTIPFLHPVPHATQVRAFIRVFLRLTFL